MYALPLTGWCSASSICISVVLMVHLPLIFGIHHSDSEGDIPLLQEQAPSVINLITPEKDKEKSVVTR